MANTLRQRMTVNGTLLSQEATGTGNISLRQRMQITRRRRHSARNENAKYVISRGSSSTHTYNNGIESKSDYAYKTVTKKR